MNPGRLEELARVVEQAADSARKEILPRFRNVGVEEKSDGSPVTEADRAAERAIRAVLRAATPDFGIIGEEFGEERHESLPDQPVWVIDPIDGTISFSRGMPMFATLIALVEGGETRLGLLDLPALDERFVAWQGGGCRRDGVPVRISSEGRLTQALVAHGDPFAFEHAGQRPAFERLARECPMLRGYTDAFGHAQVLAGGVDVMFDVNLNEWDVAASRVLVPEAGGTYHEFPQANGKTGFIFGSPPLVAELATYLAL